MARANPIIAPFWRLLALKAPDAGVGLVFQKEPDLSVIAHVRRGKPWVPVTEGLRAQLERVDHEGVLGALQDGKARRT